MYMTGVTSPRGRLQAQILRLIRDELVSPGYIHIGRMRHIDVARILAAVSGARKRKVERDVLAEDRLCDIRVD